MESGHNSVSGDDFKIMGGGGGGREGGGGGGFGGGGGGGGGEIWGRACGKKMGEELLMGLLYLLQTSEEGDGVV